MLFDLTYVYLYNIIMILIVERYTFESIFWKYNIV